MHSPAARCCTALALSCAGLVQAQPAEVQELDRVTVTVGRGQLRSVQGLSRAEFENAVAGTSPLATVSRLPGVNFQAADALGNYEWSTRFTVRGFGQNQLGFTLDDVPLGDMSYANANGLHISRAIASENVARATLSQGSGALETASSSNLGGTLQFYSVDPDAAAGARLQQTFGSHADRRSHLRLDSGETGFGALLLSLTRQDADKWKGAGQQRQTQLNLKYVGRYGETRLSAFANTSSRREMDYQDMSLEMIQRLGARWDYFYPDFAAAIRAANTLCGNNGSSYVPQCDDAYYAGAGLRNDELYGASVDTRLASGLQLKATAYRHHDRGAGLWFTPYTPSPDGTPISLRTTEYGIQRGGLLATLEAELGAHQIKAGLWHEGNDFSQARRFYAASPGALPGPYGFPTGPFLTQWQYAFETRTEQFSLADQWSLTQDLTLGFGFKSIDVRSTGRLEIGSGRPSGSVRSHKAFLPQFGLNYQLSATDELFANAGRAMRAFQAAATDTTPFATTQAGFDAIQGRLRPETSDHIEAGWRRQGSQLQASLTAYLVNFRDRLLGVLPGAAIAGNPMVLANVGSVRSTGLEAAVSLRLAPGLNWYNGLSRSRSTYRDDVLSNGLTVATAGKQVVDAPATMLKSVLGYERHGVFASLGLDYMSRRYFSYLNDAAVPARTLLNLSAGLRGQAFGPLSEGSLSLGINNLGNRRYVSTVGSNGFGNSGDNQTLLPGAPRQWFLSLSGRI